jgi:hypothetical protein
VKLNRSLRSDFLRAARAMAQPPTQDTGKLGEWSFKYLIPFLKIRFRGFDECRLLFRSDFLSGGCVLASANEGFVVG